VELILSLATEILFCFPMLASLSSAHCTNQNEPLTAEDWPLVW